MSLTLRLKVPTATPIVVTSIVPRNVMGLSLNQAAELEIQHGNQQVSLGSLFHVNGHEGQEDIVWEGDLSHVHWIGARMRQGHVLVKGNAGRHLGSQMSGGEILVGGNVGDYVGCEMTGGMIRVQGNAADWVGAAYPGNKIGVNRGLIVVDGVAGRGVAMAMRRGTICIGGSVGPLAGWNMRAGTLIIGGQTKEMLGKGMLRGTILLANHKVVGRSIAEDALGSVLENLPPTFTHAGRITTAALGLLIRWAKSQALPVNLNEASTFWLFHGDHLRGGRGEVIIADASEHN